MDIDTTRDRSAADWPVLDLSRAIFNLWNPFGVRVAAPEGPMTQAEHIRENGEPFGRNGA